MSTFWILVWGFSLVSAGMGLLWLWAAVHKNAGWVDVGWSLGIGVLTLYYAFTLEGYFPRLVMVTIVTCLWSFRLGFYLLLNRIIGRPEDGRYQTLRNRWRQSADVFFFLFFQAQGALVFLFSLPPLIAMTHPTQSLRFLDFLGLAIWFVSLAGESLADWQLASFRSCGENLGKTCRAGMWRYSRHPNYFFEWIQWWSYVVISIGAPYGWLTLIGPVLMMFFLFRVTGIPAIEAQAIASRGEDYRRYQRSTNAFFPWFPKGE